MIEMGRLEGEGVVWCLIIQPATYTYGENTEVGIYHYAMPWPAKCGISGIIFGDFRTTMTFG